MKVTNLVFLKGGDTREIPNATGEDIPPRRSRNHQKSVRTYLVISQFLNSFGWAWRCLEKRNRRNKRNCDTGLLISKTPSVVFESWNRGIKSLCWPETNRSRRDTTFHLWEGSVTRHSKWKKQRDKSSYILFLLMSEDQYLFQSVFFLLHCINFMTFFLCQLDFNRWIVLIEVFTSF